MFMGNSKYVKNVTVKSYRDLADIIHNENIDLRKNYVFRGLEDPSYDLVPSALRDKNNKLNNFIGKDFLLFEHIDIKDANKLGIVNNNAELGQVLVERDKTGKILNWPGEKVFDNDGVFQVKKELYVLFKFLNFADRNGLKVTDNVEVRQNIHNYIQYSPKWWPEGKFMEIMSLAQHYGLPTRLLDWSYDYKSALYFALKDIVEVPRNSDGILWAFNYKLFENVNNYGVFFNKLHFYRPEYNRNPNLQAQKGLFTFIVDDVNQLSKDSLDKRLIDEQNGKKEDDDPYWFSGQYAKIANVYFPDDEFLFYKIKIPKDKKPLFLKELYADGYSEEYLFPGYGGAVKAMENRVKLEKLL